MFEGGVLVMVEGVCVGVVGVLGVKFMEDVVIVKVGIVVVNVIC